MAKKVNFYEAEKCKAVRTSSFREKSKDLRFLFGLYRFFAPYKGQLFGATSVLIITALLSLTLPLAVRGIVDSFSTNKSVLLNRYFVMAIIIAAFLALGTAARYYMVTRLGERIVADLRMDVFNRVISMSPTFFEKILTGEVLSRLTTDTTLILSVVSSSVSFAMRNILIFLGGLLFMTYTSPKLAGLSLLIVPIILLPILFLGRKLRSLSRSSQDKLADSSGVASEILLAAQTVQANTHEEYSKKTFKNITEQTFEIAKTRIFVRSILTAVLIFFVFTGIVTVIWFGAMNVRSGSMTEGELVQFLIYAVLVAGSIAALSETFGELQRAAGASERLLELLKLTDPIVEKEVTFKHVEPVKGSLVFENVSFSYPTRLKFHALRNFNLNISSGETVALVGPSGAGKSTIFKILLRFYEPQSGLITIDGIALDNLSKAYLRSLFALVPQEPVIFGTTAMENIRFSRPDASDKEVVEAALAAAADGFISDLPHGYQTFVGERGIMLSGGEKQRIAIARAILRDAPILLLDEATSSLDSISEKAVQRAFEEISKTRTTIVVAHRLATVKKANKIILIENGSIKSIGTHKDLVENDEMYSKLADLQFVK